MRTRLLLALLLVTSLALLTVAVLVGRHDGGGTQPEAAAGTAGPAPDRTTLTGAIALAQDRLRRLPSDHETWAQLGSAYVQQARVTADPSFYPKAEGALKRSLSLEPVGNADAFLGLGALANARHDFADALGWGRKAEAANAYDASAYGVVGDAQTQLGDYRGAEASIQKMLDLQPGVSSFARASYAIEQRGDVAAARSAMTRALKEASDPADIAFCRYYLGELSFNSGDPRAAMTQYEAGLAVRPESDQLLAGRAKALAALGRTDDAVRDYATVVGRVPLPEYVLEYGQLLQSLGRGPQARTQFELLGSIQQLFAANGVVDDLSTAVFEADHGPPAEAVRHARAEWQRRHSVLVADALAWALHRSGDDAQALRYAVQADRLGWRNATFAYHRGMIELGLGRKAHARASLERALAINPYFSPLQVPQARAALASLGDSR